MKYNHILRLIDFKVSLVSLIILVPILLLIYLILTKETSSPIFFQQRVGRKKKTFTIIKFRTMKMETASLPSHLVNKNSIAPFGRFLRQYKLDELPQLWNVLKGEMSLVGPRPCLLNQSELISERDKYGVFNLRPGITGLAQIRGIDMSKPKLLAQIDAKMVGTLNLKNYFKYIILTILRIGREKKLN